MSRKIDALVAEKVMGWEVVSWRDRWAHVPMSYAMVIANPDDTLWQRTRPNVADKQWNPSTDIAAAWEVINRLRDDGWSISLYMYSGGSCVCSITCPYGPCKKHGSNDKYNGHGVEEVHGETVPLAICTAALKAVGVNVDAEEEK